MTLLQCGSALRYRLVELGNFPYLIILVDNHTWQRVGQRMSTIDRTPRDAAVGTDFHVVSPSGTEFRAR